MFFLQKAALEKRNKELKEWQDKQKDPGVQKMVSPLLHFFHIPSIRSLDIKLFALTGLADEYYDVEKVRCLIRKEFLISLDNDGP